MDFDLQPIIDTFVAEVDETVSMAEQALLRLEAMPDDVDAIDTVFRVAHSIKGNAASLDFEGLADLAHVTEDLLEGAREGVQSISRELVSLLLEAMDSMRAEVLRAASGKETPPSLNQLIAKLEAASEAKPVAGTNGSPATSEVAEAPGQQTQEQRSIRVSLERLDRLLTLTSEISIARGHLAGRLVEAGSPRMLVEQLHESDGLYNELQEVMTQLRMVPIAPLFRRQQRTVRDLAFELGKEARLVVEGEDSELDAAVIDRLRDPLNHMVRNAIDHGIELPELRKKAGKHPRGLLTLRARHQAGSILIEVEDDGAGIDTGVIEQKAGVSKTSQRELEDIVFAPGFSTAAQVTEISGRGVGLDVVKTQIRQLRGNVHMRSEPGLGTCFTIQVPLTLALIEAFRVQVAGESYLMPLDVVAETLAFDSLARSDASNRGLFDLRGTTLPWVRLRSLLGLEGEPPSREGVVIVHWRGGRAGLVCDELLGGSQIVLKPLAKLFAPFRWIFGSAILEDGAASLILDVPELLRRHTESRPRFRWQDNEARTLQEGI